MLDRNSTGHPAAGLSSDLRRRIAERVAQCLQHSRSYADRFGAVVPAPELRFDLRGQTAGQCRWQPGRRPQLRFNLALAERHADDFVANTVAHEVAHLVTLTCHGAARPHGSEWRAVMRHLGIADPQRCHSYRVVPGETRRQRRWTYACSCSQHALSTTRHRRAQQRGVEYRCRRCGSVLRQIESDAGNGVQADCAGQGT